MILHSRSYSDNDGQYVVTVVENGEVSITIDSYKNTALCNKSVRLILSAGHHETADGLPHPSHELLKEMLSNLLDSLSNHPTETKVITNGLQ